MFSLLLFEKNKKEVNSLLNKSALGMHLQKKKLKRSALIIKIEALE